MCMCVCVWFFSFFFSGGDGGGLQIANCGDILKSLKLHPVFFCCCEIQMHFFIIPGLKLNYAVCHQILYMCCTFNILLHVWL